MARYRGPAWHNCRRWWKKGFECPFDEFEEGVPRPDDDDDDDDEIPPVPIAPERRRPSGDTAKERVREPVQIRVLEDVLAQPFPTPDPTPVSAPARAPAPAPVPRHVPISPPQSTPTRVPAPHRQPVRAIFRAVREQQRMRTTGQLRKGQQPWSAATSALGAAAAAAASFGKGSNRPSGPPSAGAEVASSGLIEKQLVTRIRQRQNRGSVRSREQRGAVEEAESIVKGRVPTRPHIVPPREREQRDRPRRVRTGVAIGVASAITAAAVNRFFGGGRGGGFHSPARLFRGRAPLFAK